MALLMLLLIFQLTKRIINKNKGKNHQILKLLLFFFLLLNLILFRK